MIVRLDREGPLARQIYESLSEAIRAGELRPGERLPPSRRLASDLDVSRNTVVTAYQQLQAEGYVETSGAAGTAVSRDLPARGLADRFARADSASGEPRRRAGRLSREARRTLRSGGVFSPLTVRERGHLRWHFDYNANLSDPLGRRSWHRVLRRVSSRFERHAAEFDFSGQPGALHEALVRHLRLTRGVVCEPERIFVLGSAQHAFRIAARLTLEPGDTAVLEDPHYIGARTTLAAQGARLVPVGVDDLGLRVSRLPERGHPRLVYTTPSHQWPTGAVQPLGRRLELLEWARRHRAWILENDHNCEYRYEGPPVPSIQGLDPGDRVIYVSAFHRVFSPTLSLAFAVVPASLVGHFRAASLLDGTAISPIEEEGLAEFLTSGEMEKLLRRVWRRARDARADLLAALRSVRRADLRVQAAATGMHLHVTLRGWSAREARRLVEEADRRGVGIYPDEPFHLRPPAEPGLLLGFWGLEREQIEGGVTRLGECMDRIRPNP